MGITMGECIHHFEICMVYGYIIYQYVIAHIIPMRTRKHSVIIIVYLITNHLLAVQMSQKNLKESHITNRNHMIYDL